VTIGYTSELSRGYAVFCAKAAIFLICILILPQGAAWASVKTGLDVLIAEQFAPLKGKRVGVITAQTGVTENGRRIIDILAQAPGVKLTAIFTPEHGLEGNRDDRNIEDSVDRATGVQVYSLYNAGHYRPTPEMLKDVDVLVYDIQQNGARFLTRITTLGYTMEAAAQKGIPYYVLDRPNGINGVDFEGPLLDDKYVSFVGYMRMPIRHGMTAGELAQMYNGEKHLGVDLHVIRMEGWRRSMWYDETGLMWIDPSPNIRNLTEAILYPGVCLLESSQISVGRGTDSPFERIGAPWYRAREVADYLNSRDIPGVRFVPRRFTPKASVYKDQECEGLDIVLVNRQVFDPVLMGMELLSATLKFHPGKFDLSTVMRILGSDEAADRLKRGETGRQVLQDMHGQLDEFAKIRAKYLLYEAAQAQPDNLSPEQTGSPQNPSPMVEHARAHQRLEQSVPEGRREKLALGTLFLPARLKLKSPVPILFFFHGPTWVPEVAAAQNGDTAVVAIQIGAGLRVYAQPFVDPKFFGNLLAEAETKAGVKFGPITLAGWSAGNGAIRQIMSTPEYYDRVENAILIDGIHTNYVNGKPGPLESEINPAQLQTFVKMARDAVAGRKHVIITHTEIFPGTFASTTETADYILSQLGLHRQPIVKFGPMGTQELSEVRAGNFLLIGFAGNSGPDHVDQLHSLPEFLKWLK
jgi:uncharacterized protein YbbC (DUF1343 family)